MDEVAETHRSQERTREKITTSILRSRYDEVQSLQEYLEIILAEDAGQDGNSSIVAMVDSPQFQEFMAATMVALDHKIGDECRKSLKRSPPRYSMIDTVRQVQLKELEAKGSSILTMGLDLDPENLPGSPAIVGRNSVALAFENPEWEQLLQRIGVDAMKHLLLKTCIFCPLPNECLCQLTGKPIVDLPPKFEKRPIEPQTRRTGTKRPLRKPLADTDIRPFKRPKFQNQYTQKEGKTILNKPQDIQLARSRIFFARPPNVPNKNVPVVGLPPQHVLNRIHPSYANKASRKADLKEGTEGLKTKSTKHPLTQVEMDSAKEARHLSKYIFPEQYDLPTAFRYVSTHWEPYPDFLNREPSIASFKTKTPKRLREVLPLLDKLIWRHKKCDYLALRNIACPTKIKGEGGSGPLDASVILELMSEQSIQLATQPSLRLNEVSLDSSGNPIQPLGPTQIMKHAQVKPKFAEFECSHYEVFRYAALVTNAVIPKALWGSKANYTLVLKNVKRFIECRRFETLTLHYLLQGFRTSDCEWLMPPGEKAKTQSRVSVSDAIKRRELLEGFMFWYFDGFLMPLLKTTFYITESSAFRNRILYFRQDDWKALSAPLLERLLGTMFVKISDREIHERLRQRKLGFSFVRLLPKDTGVRPIVNLRGKSRQAGSSTQVPVNVILRAAFDILTYERTARTHLLGASVLGPDEVYVQLKAFKENFMRGSSQMPKLYFVKVDVQAAFDTIEQSKLLEILRHLLSEDAYSLHKYGQMQYTNAKPKRSFKRKAYPRGEEPHFLKLASDLANQLWNTVFCPPTGYKRIFTEEKEDVLRLLEDHITDNMVKIGKHYYKQNVGIPQGSILSTMLCSFFYGDLERQDERLHRLRVDPRSLLMRLVDDYLFVTADLSKARLFLDIMNQGHPEYGCFIGRDKTLTNIDYDAQVMNVVDPSMKSFPWCGYLINMRDLSVTVDYSRYATWGIRNTLTVDRGKRPGTVFLHKMLLLARSRCHVIYSDTTLNPENVVYLNIYQNMILSALKVQEYVREAKLLSRGRQAFLHKAIQKIVNAGYSSVRAQVKRKSKLNSGNAIPCVIKKPAALWLGFHAFRYVLSRKAQYFRAVLPFLDKELQQVQNRCYKRRFKQLVREGQPAFDYGKDM